jgi:rhodanese-related sulfurtransferase
MTRNVDALTLAERLGDATGPRPTIVDIRAPAEFEAAPIPGAVNAPKAKWLTGTRWAP